MKVQVGRNHYDFNNYVDEHRWNSYWNQINEALKAKGDTVLVIGAGDGIVADVLRKFGKKVDTFDFDKALKPDIVGSVTEIDKIVKNRYDVVLCCQVLEHIPFDKFEGVIGRIKNVLTDGGTFILSLPNNSIRWIINLKIPKMPEIKKKAITKKPIRKKWDIDRDGFGEHYWEINAKGTEEKVIKKILSRYFTIEKRFLPSDNLYHIFYVLK